MTDNVIIGKLTLLHDEVLKLYFEHKYIITHGAIYQLFYSNAQRRAYAAEIFRSSVMRIWAVGSTKAVR